MRAVVVLFCYNMDFRGNVEYYARESHLEYYATIFELQP